jgi:hypothetical protein
MNHRPFGVSFDSDPRFSDNAPTAQTMNPPFEFATPIPPQLEQLQQRQPEAVVVGKYAVEVDASQVIPRGKTRFSDLTILNTNLLVPRFRLHLDEPFTAQFPRGCLAGWTSLGWGMARVPVMNASVFEGETRPIGLMEIGLKFPSYVLLLYQSDASENGVYSVNLPNGKLVRVESKNEKGDDISPINRLYDTNGCKGFYVESESDDGKIQNWKWKYVRSSPSLFDDMQDMIETSKELIDMIKNTWYAPDMPGGSASIDRNYTRADPRHAKPDQGTRMAYATNPHSGSVTSSSSSEGKQTDDNASVMRAFAAIENIYKISDALNEQFIAEEKKITSLDDMD